MRKIIFSAFVLLMAMVSCQKNTVPEQAESRAIPMTLTVTIGADTKITYTDEDNVLKTEWELYDKVSLLAVDISGNLISNDIFTAQSAGKTVDFAGEFTNDPNTKAVYVYYPALAQGDGTKGNPYSVYSPDSYNAYGVLNGAIKGDPYITFSNYYQLQRSNAGTSHLEQYLVMSGEASLDGLNVNNMDVTLEHRSYVIKASITLPDEGLTVYSAAMNFTLQSPSVGVGGFGWTCINEKDLFPGNSQDNDLKMLFGNDIDSGYGTGITLDGDKLVVYFPAYAASFWSQAAESYLWNTIKEGDKVSFIVEAQEGTYILNDFEFTKETVLENGKMYRISATLQKETTE